MTDSWKSLELDARLYRGQPERVFSLGDRVKQQQQNREDRRTKFTLHPEKHRLGKKAGTQWFNKQVKSDSEIKYGIMG